jgi:iron complex outermembrane recepter protein
MIKAGLLGIPNSNLNFNSMLQRKKILTLLFLCLLAGEGLNAQTPATYEAWLDSINSKNYISREILLDELTITEERGQKKSGNTSTDQLLQDLAKVEMMRRGAFAAEPVMRGLASERYRTTIDGMRIYGACTDKMDPVSSYVEKNNMEALKLSFGGNDLDADFGPAIHFNLKKPNFNSSKPVIGQAGVNFSSSDRGFNQFMDFNLNNTALAFRGNFAHRKSENYRPGGGGRVAFSQYEKINYSAAIAYRLHEKTLVSFDFLGDDAWNVGYPSLPMDVSFAKAKLFSLGIYHAGKDGKADYEVKLYHNFIKHAMDDSQRPDVSMRMDMPGETATSGLNLKSGLINNASNILLFNLESYYTRAYAEMTMYPEEGKPMFMLTWPDTRRYGIKPSFSFSWNLSENNKLNAGAGVELASSGINGLGKKQLEIFYGPVDGKNIQPLFSGKIDYSLNLNRYWSIIGLLSFSERLPAVSEHYGYYLFGLYDGYDYLGNPNLKKEGLAVSQVTINFIKSRWRMNADIYRFDFHNYIMGVADSKLSPMTMGANGVKIYSNIGEAQMLGAEMEFDVSLSEKVKLMNTFAYCHGNDTDGEPLPMLPPFKNQLSFEYQWNNFRLQPAAIWAAQQNRVSDKFHEKKSPSFFLMHFKAQKNYDVGKGRISIAAGVENILDRRYKEHLDWGNIPRQGRSFFTNFSWQL